MKTKLRLGISACLLGERVRWDGGDKREGRLLAALAKDVGEWVSVCPELELGLGAPREPVRLARRGGRVRMLGVTSGADHTEAMERWVGRRVAELERLGLHGYVLKARSPSCGAADVKVHDARGRVASQDGRGLFARELIERLSGMPVEDEERLADPRRLARFVAAARAYAKSMRPHE